jgi:hypothetical protein
MSHLHHNAGEQATFEQIKDPKLKTHIKFYKRFDN